MILKKVTEENLWQIAKLKVKAGQESFVASNSQSIMEAYVAITSDQVALPFGIYDEDDTLVGFVMFGYGATGDEDEPRIADGNYCIWRFMIDQKYQGKGLGRKALLCCLDYIKTEPCGKADYCWLSYEPENVAAKKLYESAGFSENGELCGDEIVSVLGL